MATNPIPQNILYFLPSSDEIMRRQGFTYFLAEPAYDLSRESGNLAERASIRELEQQDLEKLTVFSTDSFTTTLLHVLFPEDIESRPNPITLKTWIELTNRIKNKIKICCNL
ncbi:hypothetical protein F8M41_022750 [Gigaspora margarita]|uniref:Uncharacterized protein n=1 Tax=Gigaspora margarita TaxID=4874 RepID=A0A8H4AEK0_GIGMA|nr:hypothetical protein F8M41_022750 [Gigaspora margarita]